MLWKRPAPARRPAKKGPKPVPTYPVSEELSYVAQVGGTRTFFPTDDPYVRQWFYPRLSGGLLHEPPISRALVKSVTDTSIFVDVGAHLGYFSMLAAHTCSQVFAIEAQESLIGRIHINAAANHFENVHTIMAAAGNTRGFVTIPKSGRPSTSIGGDATNLVPSIRLDDYFTGDLTPTHIKIDTEGYEYHVLDGAKEILETRPVLLIELHTRMEGFGHTIDDMIALLNQYDYAITASKHRKGGKAGHEIPRDELGKLNNEMVICRPR